MKGNVLNFFKKVIIAQGIEASFFKSFSKEEVVMFHFATIAALNTALTLSKFTAATKSHIDTNEAIDDIDAGVFFGTLVFFAKEYDISSRI